MPTIKEQVDAAKSLSFRDCCEIIYKDLAHRSSGTFRVCAAYAKAGLTIQEGTREATVQARYVLCNLSHWRHPQAKMIRARLHQLARGTDEP